VVKWSIRRLSSILLRAFVVSWPKSLLICIVCEIREICGSLCVRSEAVSISVNPCQNRQYLRVHWCEFVVRPSFCPGGFFAPQSSTRIRAICENPRFLFILAIRAFEFRICFGFRASYFEFLLLSAICGYIQRCQ